MTTFNKIAYFGQIPPEVMKQLNKTACKVLMLIYHYSDANGEEAYPGIDRLARDCATPQSSINNALRQLRELGCIEQVSRGGRAGDGRKWASNYRLRVPVSTSGELEMESASQPPKTDISISNSEMSISNFDVSTSGELDTTKPTNTKPTNTSAAVNKPNHQLAAASYVSKDPPSGSQEEQEQTEPLPRCAGCNRPVFEPWKPKYCNLCRSSKEREKSA